MKKNVRTFITTLLLLSLQTGLHGQSHSDLLKKGNKVFVIAPDNGAVTHAKNALDYWDYWKVVEDRNQADIIANFKIERTAGLNIVDYKGYIQICNAKTNAVLLQTDELNTNIRSGWNKKEVVIRNLVKKRLIPEIEKIK